MAAARGRRPAVPEPAYVLHHHDWSESSLVLDLFTRGHGRVAVVAKGAKRPYSQLRPVLLPLQRLAVQISRLDAPDGAAEVHTLRTAEWAGGRPMPSGEALYAGFHLNELLVRLLARGDPHPGLFDAYAATVEALGTGGAAAVDDALRAFELVLLRDVGWLPDLAVVLSTQQPVQPGRGYRLRPERGLSPVVDGDDGESAIAVDGAVWAALQRALDAQRLDLLQATCALAAGRLKGQLRELLHYHLAIPQLRTRRIVRELQRLSGAAPAAPSPGATDEPADRA